MINNVELFINEPSNAQLDLSNEVKVSLQYSLADIRDISKRNSAFSKTILIPGTKNNNFWLGNLFDINSDFTAFNPNKKTPAKLLVNTSVVIDGFLQLRKIKKLSNVDLEGNLIQYEVVLFNNAVDLMSELGEKKLNQLDLNEYNHTYNYNNIINSWDNTWQDGYVYPMYGLGGNPATQPTYFTTGEDKQKFYPAIFYKTVFNKIIEEAGFGWTGSLASNEQFEKEIIPFVGDGLPKISEAEQERRRFEAISQGATYQTANFPSSIFSSTSPFDTRLYPYDYDVPPLDPSNHWNTTSFYWDVDRNGIYDLSYGVNFNVTITNNEGAAVQSQLGNTPKLIVKLKLQKQTTGSTLWTNLNVMTPGGPLGYFLSPFLLSGASTTVSVQTTNLVSQLNLNAGDKVRLVVELSKGTGAYQFNFGASTDLDCEIEFLDTNNYIRNFAYRNTITEGDEVEWEQFLPDKLKQKDLLTDLIKRYNLYIQIDPDNPRNIILDTRSDFYSSDIVLDWTEKKDFSREDQIQLLSEVQAKDMLFTFKADSADAVNKLYTDQTGDVFGEFTYTFDNDFVKGEKKIETPFSPTPLAQTSFGAITPALDPAKPKGAPRVLYYGGLKTCNPWSFSYISGGNAAIATYTQYPYAGYYDDPRVPNLNNMFGNPKYEFYNGRQVTTTNTMYNRYWADYINQIEDGKLVTSFFYLNEKDISFIKNNLNAKIFVKDSYYYVNKIIDYNALENAVTKVELLKIKDGVTWVEQNVGDISGGEACPDDIYVIKKGTKWYYDSFLGEVTEECCDSLKGTWDEETQTCAVKFIIINDNPGDISFPYDAANFSSKIVNNTGVTSDDIVSGINNTVGGSYLYSPTGNQDDNIQLKNNFVVIGNDNNVTSNEALVVGDNNIVNDKTLIVGDNNIIESSKAILLAAENNTVKSNAILIGTSGKTQSIGDKVLLGNEFNIDTITGDVQWKGADVVIPTENEIVRTSVVRIEPADVQQLFTTPITLIDAPADTQYIDILSVTMKMYFGSVNYEGDTTLTIWYDGAVQETFEGNGFLAFSKSGLYKFSQSPSTDIQVVEGSSVYVTTVSDNPVNGDSVIEIITTYKIVS